MVFQQTSWQAIQSRRNRNQQVLLVPDRLAIYFQPSRHDGFCCGRGDSEDPATNIILFRKHKTSNQFKH